MARASTLKLSARGVLSTAGIELSWFPPLSVNSRPLLGVSSCQVFTSGEHPTSNCDVWDDGGRKAGQKLLKLHNPRRILASSLASDHLSLLLIRAVKQTRDALLNGRMSRKEAGENLAAGERLRAIKVRRRGRDPHRQAFRPLVDFFQGARQPLRIPSDVRAG